VAADVCYLSCPADVCYLPSPHTSQPPPDHPPDRGRVRDHRLQRVVAADDARAGGPLVVHRHAGPCMVHTLQPTTSTIHYTLHPTPYTLHPAPYTLHPTPQVMTGCRASRATPKQIKSKSDSNGFKIHRLTGRRVLEMTGCRASRASSRTSICSMRAPCLYPLFLSLSLSLSLYVCLYPLFLSLSLSLSLWVCRWLSSLYFCLSACLSLSPKYLNIVENT